jgi:hypothetical protein
VQNVIARADRAGRFFQKPLIVKTLLTAVLPLVIGSCVRKPSVGVFVDPAFGPLVPPDTRYMAGIRLDKIRETPFYKQLNGRFDLDRRLDLFAERTGLDPRKDMWYILVASNGKDTLLLARGRFTVGEMEPKLGALGSTRMKYKDYTLIGNPETSVAFINPGVAAAGTQSVLENLIDHRGQWSDLPAQLAAKLRTMSSGDQLWMVSDAPFPDAAIAGPDTTGMKSMLSNLLGYMKETQAGVHIDRGADFKASIECVSEEGAQRVRDAVKGAIGLARLNTREDEMQMLKLYDAVQVNQKAANVDIQAEIAPDLVDPLLKMLPQTKRPAQ